MKKLKFLSTFFAVILMIMLMTACCKIETDTAQSNEASGICGSWAYIHDKETAIAVFRKEGIAQYEGKDYSFECDSQFIKLKNKEGETKQLRYVLDDDGMYLYSKNTYTFCDEGEQHGLVGEWTCAEKNWSYTFADTGTFMEDGFFPGNYTVDDKNSTIKLVYNDQFEDTVCFFRIEENKLYVEYPWRMVRLSAK